MTEYDAIIVPATGGQTTTDLESMPVWSIDVLKVAAKKWERHRVPLILSAASTVYKARPLDPKGHNIKECTSMNMYLQKLGVDPDQIYEEAVSRDTIGNAVFVRLIHTDVRKWRKLLVIDADFHLNRVVCIFDNVFGLQPSEQYSISYESVPTDPDNEILQMRRDKEAEALEKFKKLWESNNFRSMEDIHKWMYGKHKAYAAPYVFELLFEPVEMDKKLLNSY